MRPWGWYYSTINCIIGNMAALLSVPLLFSCSCCCLGLQCCPRNVVLTTVQDLYLHHSSNMSVPEISSWHCRFTGYTKCQLLNWRPRDKCWLWQIRREEEKNIFGLSALWADKLWTIEEAQLRCYLIKLNFEVTFLSHLHTSSCSWRSLSLSPQNVHSLSSPGEWGHYICSRGSNTNLWPRGHTERIMTQLPVYYHLANLIRPNPKPANGPDLHRSVVCLSEPVCMVSVRKSSDRLIFPLTDWSISSLIQPVNEKMLLFQDFVAFNLLTMQSFVAQPQGFFSTISHIKRCMLSTCVSPIEAP